LSKTLNIWEYRGDVAEAQTFL